ncbi:YqcC family protein [Pseudoalteromonas xiamenensis]|uniref:YqcC family protein n=1 Tax=Pseudoalteromonas xiamenensis TaxID=882626 RepID=UPI0027E5269D|nr:YqcC family protein [Pseudoalteromonas xiamenensis]WMN59769.1 YqcC family protein [Pseudoalteromonas xiamenensis]
MQNRYELIADLLVALQLAMHEENLWQSAPLSHSAYNSSAPFCCDTMTFGQWLQFVFIPKMNELIKSEQALPTQLSLLPMLEVSYPNSQKLSSVYSVITRLDTLFTK